MSSDLKCCISLKYLMDQQWPLLLHLFETSVGWAVTSIVASLWNTWLMSSELYCCISLKFLSDEQWPILLHLFEISVRWAVNYTDASLWNFCWMSSDIDPCFVMQYLVSSLVLQSSRWGRESWLLYINCHLDVMFCLFDLLLYLPSQ